MPFYTKLSTRGIIKLEGADSLKLLQGLVTNDVYTVQKEGVIYALMLTPQGRFLYDFFIFSIENEVYVDCEKEHIPAIMNSLNMRKLRSDVSISDVSDEFKVLYVDSYLEGAFKDPRSKNLGFRVYTREELNSNLEENSNLYLDTIFEFNIPEPHMDMIQEKSFPMEYEMDKFNAISFTKGCYLGQELTARTKHTGTVRKKSYKLDMDIDAPKGTELFIGESKIGILCSRHNNQTKALLKIEEYENNKSALRTIRHN